MIPALLIAVMLQAEPPEVGGPLDRLRERIERRKPTPQPTPNVKPTERKRIFNGGLREWFKKTFDGSLVRAASKWLSVGADWFGLPFVLLRAFVVIVCVWIVSRQIAGAIK